MTRPIQEPALLLGVPIDDVTMADTLKFVGEFVADGRSLARTHQIATVNVDFLVNAVGDATLKRVLQRADLCLADGMPVVWAARRYGVAMEERVTGADLVPALAATAATSGWRIHFFGSAPGVAERAREILTERHPGVQITADSGPVIGDPTVIEPAIVERIRSANPDILCVALGNPKQERFIETYRKVLGSPVMIGIGGSLDMLVGDKRRAPRWMQTTGTEWIFRALQEPGRLGRRYAHDARVFLPRAARYLRLLPPYRGGADLQLTIADGVIRVSAEVPTAGVSGSRHADAVAAGLRSGSEIVLQLGDIAYLTPSGMSRLVQILRLGRRHGCALRAEPIAPSLRQQIAEMDLGGLFEQVSA